MHRMKQDSNDGPIDDGLSARCGDEVTTLRTELQAGLIRTEDARRAVASAQAALEAAERSEASIRRKLKMWEGFERATAN